MPKDTLSEEELGVLTTIGLDDKLIAPLEIQPSQHPNVVGVDL